MRKSIQCILFASVLLAPVFPAAAARRAAFITEGDPGAPGSHGLAKLKEALQAKGIDVPVAPTAGTVDATVFAIVRPRCSGLRQTPEGLLIRRGVQDGKPAVILCGAD